MDGVRFVTDGTRIFEVRVQLARNAGRAGGYIRSYVLLPVDGLPFTVNEAALNDLVPLDASVEHDVAALYRELEGWEREPPSWLS